MPNVINERKKNFANPLSVLNLIKGADVCVYVSITISLDSCRAQLLLNIHHKIKEATKLTAIITVIINHKSVKIIHMIYWYF